MTNRKGFTLIELLIVVVIIGILAAIAIPKFSATKTKAQRSAAIADLRNLATAQEAHFADHNQYANAVTNTAAGVNANTVFFQWSPGNTAGAMTGGATSWSAVVTNGAGQQCSIFYNMAAVAPATADGVPACAP